jgi:outer membrane protein insertion porin family
VVVLKFIINCFILTTFSLISFAFASDFVPARGAVVKKIEWNHPNIEKRYNSYLQDLLNRPYDTLNLKIKIDQIVKELFLAGYFNAVVKPELSGTDKSVTIKVIVDFKDRINFSFSGNKIYSHQELRSKIVDKVRNEFGKADINSLSNYISELYEVGGFYETSVRSYQSEGKDLENVGIKNFFFVINEGKKIKVREVIYRGNVALRGSELETFFHENATSLAKGGFLDRVFLDQFTDILKKEYLSRGFVFVEVSKPRVVTNELDGSVTIEYGISEKQQVTLRTIYFEKVPQELQESAKKNLINREGAPLNVVEIENDLRKMIIYFQGEGYYFATVANLNSDNLLVYDKDYSMAELRPEIALDRQVCFNEAIINGNIKTKSDVIRREILIKPLELITPEKLENLRQRLAGLNLFSSLSITPYMINELENLKCPKTNLVIQAKEKDFGLVEVAPGYRTDLGAKLSTGISYNNISGKNRSASLRAQLNQRFNLDGFDERREQENKKLLEYSAKASYVEPYLFYNFLKSQVEFELSTSFQRVRFYGFDADVFRLSPQFSKTFSRTFSSSVRYQFERIIQFDATETKDNDNFSIGGITPTVTFDFRDDPVNPRKGSFFTLSSEWANSNFGSMKQSDLEVNFIKVISRNRFYYPAGDFTLALSLAMGYQKNFADEILRNDDGSPQLNSNGAPRTVGYIPSIKVFRLDGYDEIRGYDEGEINRLRDSTPIGKVVVQNEAYFTAFKFEPRYNLTDALQVGIFFDAGRVFIQDFDPFKLRTSVGTGLKYLTPVGSLDFDYGFKLQRKTHDGASRESVGRFHLSIGFF